jgi:hypothetical protein
MFYLDRLCKFRRVGTRAEASKKLFYNLLIFRYLYIFTLIQIHANYWKNHLPPSLDGGNRQKELF